MKDYILLISEVEGHPKSMLKQLSAKFEKHSILQISSEQQLAKIKTKPIFSDRYLVVFNSFYTLKQSIQSIKYAYMLPVYVIAKREVETVTSFLIEKNVQYRILENVFTEEDAVQILLESANTDLTDKKIKRILSKTGLFPKRIITAVGILNTHGYTDSNIRDLLDFSVYVSSFEILMCLLKQPVSKKRYEAILSYISDYRSAFKYIREELLSEMDFILKVSDDILHQIPERKGILDYIEATEGLTSYKYRKIDTIIEKVSMVDLLCMKKYLMDADLLSFLVLLGGR